MFLPDISSHSSISNRNLVIFWTKLLSDGPAENLFNKEFNVFTQERHQFSPLQNPRYLDKHCSVEILQNIRNLDKYILSIIPSRINQAYLCPSYLYSIANGSPQVPHCDLSSYSDSKQEFLLLIGVQDIT